MDVDDNISDDEAENFSEEGSGDTLGSSDTNSSDEEGQRRRRQQPPRHQRNRNNNNNGRRSVSHSRHGRRSSSSSSSSDEEEDDGDGNGQGAAAAAQPPPPPPPPEYEYDARLEYMFNHSEMFRRIHEQRAFGELLEKQPMKQPKRDDPLKGCRIKQGDFPSSYEELQKFCQLDPSDAWEFLSDQLNVLSLLDEIPRYEEAAQLDFFHDLTLVLECSNVYPEPIPIGRQSEQLAEILGRLGTLVWTFYSSNRGEFVGDTKKYTTWWIAFLLLYKVSVERLRDVHGFMTDVYNTKTVRELLDKMGNRDGQTSESDNWTYIRHAYRNGFVGALADPDQFSHSLEQSTLTHSRPDPSIASSITGSGLARRGQTEFVNIIDLVEADSSELDIDCNKLPLSFHYKLLTDFNNNWHTLKWTPGAEVFLLVLLYHFSRLMFEDLELQELLDCFIHLKRKPIILPPGNVYHKPINNRFVRTVEIIFIQHLEAIRTYYTLVDQVLKKHPPSAATIKKRKVNPRNIATYHKSSVPCGFFDTILFPQCKQFLPPAELQLESDCELLQIVMCKDKVIDEIDTAAAQKQYFDMLVSAMVPPGAYDSIIGKTPSMMPKPSFLLDSLNHSLVEPVGQLTFRYLAVVTVLGYMRGEGLFAEFTTDVKHAQLAHMAYFNMMCAILYVSNFQYSKLQAQSDLIVALRSNASGGGGGEEDGQRRGHLENVFKNLNEAGLEFIAQQHVQRFPMLSAPGDDQLERTFNQTMKDVSKELAETKELADSAEDVANKPKILAIENVGSAKNFIYICNDTHKKVISRFEDRCLPTLHKLNWPRIEISKSGVCVVYTPDSHDFVLRTNDFLEALTAWFHRVIYAMGDRVRLTGGYFTIFERHLGESLRSLFSKSDNVTAVMNKR